MFGKAIAEFEFTLTFADAPIDRFARGERNALTDAKSEARCSSSDTHAVPVPQRGGAVERDVQRFPGPCHRRPSDRPQVTNMTSMGLRK